MKPILQEIAGQIQKAFQNSEAALDASKRIPSAEIFAALQSIRPLLERDYGHGHPVKCRFPGYKGRDGDFDGCESSKPFKVLEYLVDFSFSRFKIPEAIADPRIARIQNDKFELLFAAESELGNVNEVCRDLLKLLDIRSELRCLLFKRKQQSASAARLNERLLYVLHHHAHFQDTQHGWLFIGLDIDAGKVRCSPFTLADDGNSFVQLG